MPSTPATPERHGTNWHNVGHLRLAPLAVALAVSCGVGAFTGRGVACSQTPIPCQAASAAVGDGGAIPANVPALRISFSHDGRAGQQARLVRVDGGRSDVVAAHVEIPEPLDSFNALLRLDEALVEDAHYEVEMLDCGNTALTAVAEFSVGPIAPLPSSLGTVVTTEPMYQDFGLFAGGTLSCGRAVEGDLLEAHVELDPNTLPWSELFRYQAMVDGERWFDETYGWVGGSPPAGAGGTRVYRLCDATSVESYYRPEPGPHALTLTAELPGVSEPLSTQAVTVELYCEGEEFPGEEPNGVEATPSNAGGGCSVSARPTRGQSALLLAACALLLARRRAVVR